MTEDEADLKLFSLASEKRKFAIAVGHFPGQDLQDALERAQVRDHVRLIDVSTVSATLSLMRVFMLTDTGMERLAALSRDRRQ